MSFHQNDPLVDMRRVFPLGPAAQAVALDSNRGVVPFGVRYAVPSVVGAASGNTNQATKRKVSINAPTSPDGEPGKATKIDDTITEGTD
jgi:hypothetical protein